MRRQLMILAMVLATAQGASAALVVSVGDLDLPVGGSGFLDVMIRSDTGTDLLDIFGVEFRITSSGGARLEFIDPPLDPQLTDPSYIFAGDSTAALFPPAGFILSTTTTNDTYIGGDGTESGLNVTVPTTDKLLVSLAVTAATSVPPVVGDVFTISLVSGPTSFESNIGTPNEPFFVDIPYTASSGTVTMVPELSSGTLVAGLFGLFGLFGAARRRVPRTKRKAQRG